MCIALPPRFAAETLVTSSLIFYIRIRLTVCLMDDDGQTVRRISTGKGKVVLVVRQYATLYTTL